MQLMTWTMARLGSRFNLLLEPCRRRVMHSALGRFLDAPMDLMVGLVEPDGTERVLPFTTRGTPLLNCEQFARVNSITYRGYSEKYGLRFEFNLHSVFYPQNEDLCTLPAFYLEMRVNPCSRVRWCVPKGATPENVKLFIRLQRPDTQITAGVDADGTQGRIDLAYDNRLEPTGDAVGEGAQHPARPGRMVKALERIVSLTPGAVPDGDGRGLTIDLPVTEEGSGVKWRLVWGAFVGEPVLETMNGDDQQNQPAATPSARFRYVRRWKGLDEVMRSSIARRDDFLALSRRFEKTFDQAPMQAADRHLFHHSFQTYLSNTWWCDFEDGREWFSVWEGSCYFHSTIDVEYNVALLYLCLWPKLLAMQLQQWPVVEKTHEASGGAIMSHDIGVGPRIGKQAYPHDMPVEENANYLLLLQAYSHATGDLTVAKSVTALVERLARYLLWTDRDQSGFPSEGTANTIDDASPATQYSRKQTYLAIKRLAALAAAADMLERVGSNGELAKKCSETVARDAVKIDRSAWLGDHYVVCVEKSATGVIDAWTGKPLTLDELAGWDAYSIYTANGVLLPLLCGQDCAVDREQLSMDVVNAARETLGRYGCGHTSSEVDNVWVSQNLWRDHVARFLDAKIASHTDRYWDLQVMSNTERQSFGFIDTYINNNLSFYPRGIACIGWFLAQPRLVIDRLAGKGTRISVEPDTHYPQRWPLLPLADWKAGKIPICVVDRLGRVTIEGQIDPIVVRSGTNPVASGAGLIG